MKEMFSFQLDKETKEELKKEAEKKEMSISGLIRFILKGWVKNESKG